MTLLTGIIILILALIAVTVSVPAIRKKALALFYKEAVASSQDVTAAVTSTFIDAGATIKKSLTEVGKYIIRFGVVLILAVPIMALTKGWNAVQIAGYKVALAAIAVGLAELIWATFFKPVFGKAETGGLNNETSMAIMAFRGLLYSSIILALCLGL
jgi:hypothetical protein